MGGSRGTVICVSSCYFKSAHALTILLRMKIPLFAFAAVLLLTGITAAGTAKESGLDIPSGWKILKIPGKAATEFRAAPDGTIEVSASESVGFLYRELTKSTTPVTRLSWRWRVDQTSPSTDLSIKGKDDRPLAIHICFDTADAPRSRWSLLDQVGKWTRTSPLRGKVLTYVWGGTHDRGDRIENPYFKSKGQIIILRSGDSPTGRWFTESIDIAADFEKAFGYSPPMVRLIAISADMDDKRGMSMGKIADLKLHAK